jgi:hypothetical protein
MVQAVDSCGLSRSCIAPIENAEDVLRWNFGAGECRIFVRTPLPRANPLAIAAQRAQGMVIIKVHACPYTFIGQLLDTN